MWRLYGNMSIIVVVSYVVPYMFSSVTAGLYQCTNLSDLFTHIHLHLHKFCFSEMKLYKFSTRMMPLEVNGEHRERGSFSIRERRKLMGKFSPSLFTYDTPLTWSRRTIRCTTTRLSFVCGFNTFLMYLFMQGNLSLEFIWSTNVSF